MENASAAELYRLIFANLKEALVIVRLAPPRQEALEVVELNHAARTISQKLSGVGRGSLADLFPGLFEEALPQRCREAIESGRVTDLGEASIHSWHYRLSIIPLPNSHLGIIVSDTSAVKRLEEASLSLRKLSTMLQSTLDVEEILDDLIREAVCMVGAESGIASLCSTEGISSYRSFVKGEALPPETLLPGEKIPGRVIAHCDPCLANDVGGDPRLDREMAARHGVRNAISTPILDACGKMIGFLEIHNKRDGAGFTPFDLDQLNSAARITAFAVRNAEAFRKVTRIGGRLRESTERYRHLIEGVDAIVWEADAQTLQFSFVSPQAERILGYPAAQWLEPDFWVDHILPEDREQAVRLCHQATAEGKDHRFLYRAIAADGRVVWLRDHARLVVDAKGEAKRLRGLMVDITEAKRAEAQNAELLEKVQNNAAELERRVAERTAQLQERNEELDSFAHSVSHDLKAPLRAMQGFAEILLEDQPLGRAERLEYLKRILSAAQGMERLINDLLAYSRLSRSELQLQPVSLQKVVREAAQQLELASGGREYRLEIAEELPEVLGHHAVLVQVLLNLMSNGIKFVPKEVTPRLRIRGERQGGLCRLIVEDNGIGIPAEHQERIFKIFERLHSAESYPGTGVGLAIVRKAVSRLGGRIGVVSREGEGSRFWIELPAAEEE
jgi:PAS domain S-box-containing protein